MKKKMKNSRIDSKGSKTEPKLVVEKTITSERVDEIAKELRSFTYGQCLVLKRELDRRISTTRARA